MKSEIELIEYFNEKGWSLRSRDLQLMITSYNLGYNDASQEVSE